MQKFLKSLMWVVIISIVVPIIFWFVFRALDSTQENNKQKTYVDNVPPVVSEEKSQNFIINNSENWKEGIYTPESSGLRIAFKYPPGPEFSIFTDEKMPFAEISYSKIDPSSFKRTGYKLMIGDGKYINCDNLQKISGNTVITKIKCLDNNVPFWSVDSDTEMFVYFDTIANSIVFN